MLTLVLAAVLAAAVAAGPAVPTSRELHTCAGYCREGGKLSYEVGKSYIYDYRAPMTTSVNGVGSDESRLYLSATVEIHVKSHCDLTMTLGNVLLEDSVPSGVEQHTPVSRAEDFKVALERSALMFSFQDGVIDALCVSSDDPAWVLNVKRGILSMFQNSMKQLETDHKVYETDVIGECETEYKVVIGTGSNNVLFEKSKNPVACARPMDNFLSLQSAPYDSHAQSQPLVTSEHSCYVTYEEGTLLLAVCNEIHLFRPFSQGESGAVTRLQQNLLRTGISDGTPGRIVGSTTRTTLLFQHELDETDSTSRATAIVSTLEELDRKTANGVESDVPRIFAALVATLRTTGYPTLAKVFSHTREGHTRKFLLDAMPLVGSADGMTVMTDLYKSGEISDSEMDSWLTSLTFIKRPTITMLMAVSSLLDSTPRAKALLGISAMIHSLCQHDSACRDKEPVAEALGKIERLLGDGCHVKGRQDMEMKILALKAIGNAGVLPVNKDNIAKCYKHVDNPLEVRLAAITAHRRMGSVDSWRHSLLDVFTDMAQETEVRVAAYLTVMQCPSARTLQRVKLALDQEEVNQVASFVWTHLTNLQETSSRWKQNIRDLLTNDFLRNKFQTDARKFSRNYEASTFLDSLNAGATVESNVVFTPQSYLPRSAMLNLTLDIFGESVNVFEVGARAEGFEQIVEDMFGPGGYFPDKSLKQVLQKARGEVDDDLENSVDQLSSTFNAKRKLAKEPQASIYARVFGNEIHSSRYQGMDDLMGGYPHIKNPIDLFAKLFGGKDVDFTNSFVFLDASYKIPTIVGIPLEFSVNGSATVGLKMNGHVDLRDLWRKNSLEVQGQIMPSAAVEVTGTMSLDAFMAKAGLRTVSTLHTNTYLDGKVLIQGGSVVDVKLNVPRNKVEVLEVSSRMFLLHREDAVEITGDSMSREQYSDCSSPTFSQLTGMTLCTELYYQNASLSETAPYFPLTGPVELRVRLVKTDSFDSYELNFQSQADIDSLSYKVHFDTPNSLINRKVDAFLSLDAANANVIGNLQTPFIKVDVSGKMGYNENSKTLGVDIRVDDQDVLKTNVGLVTVRSSHMNRFEPSLTLFVRNLVDMELKGRVNFVEGSKYNAALKLSGLTEEPLLFSADVTAEDGRYELVGSLDSPVLAASVHANLRHSSASVSTKLTVDYSLYQTRTHTISLAGKIQNSRKGDIAKNSALASLQMSAAPGYNVVLGWELTKSDESFENKLKFGLGVVEWQTRQLYRLRSRRAGDVDFAVLCTFTCPVKNVDYQVDVQYKTTDSSFKSYMLAQLNSRHRFLAKANYFLSTPNRALSLELSCPWHSTTLEGELIETEPNTFNTRLVGKHTPVHGKAQELSLTGAYIDASTASHQLHEASVEVSGAWSAKMAAGLDAGEGNSRQWMEVEFQGKTYTAFVNLTKQMEGLYEMEVEVMLVDRTYSSRVLLLNSDEDKSVFVDLHLSKRLTMLVQAIGLHRKQTDLKFELFWNKEIDPSRRISLTANLSRERRTVLLEFPGQYIRSEVVSSPTSLNGSLEWAADQKIAFTAGWNPSDIGFVASASLTTPFPGLEAQSLNASYENSVQGLNITTNLAWLKESVAFDMSGKWLTDAPLFEGKLKLDSSFVHLTGTVQHIDSPGAIMHSHTVWLNKEELVRTTFRISKSMQPDISLSFNVRSPVTSMPYARVVLKHESRDKVLEMNFGEHKLVIQAIRRGSERTCLFSAVTPYPGFDNSTAQITFGDMKLVADVVHNKTVMSLHMSGTKSEKFVLGSAVFTSSFGKSLEVGFTHSTDDNYLKEGLSVASDGDQLILASVVGTTQLDNCKLTADLTMPSHSMIATIENRVNGDGLVSRFDGVWNNERISTAILAAYSDTELDAVASVSGSALSRKLRLAVKHTRKPGASYQTTLDVSNVGSITHELTIEDEYNWKNMVEVHATKRIAFISNKQSIIQGVPLLFVHTMEVDMNGQKVSVELSTNNVDENTPVQKINAKLTSPWTHPVELTIQLLANETSFQPKLRLEYSKTKEINIESVIQYQLTQSKLQLEVKSPFCKPITVNAFYDVSSATKAALLTTRWEDKQMDFKATVHLERGKAMGVVVATRSDVEGQIINANFKYDTGESFDMTGHLTLQGLGKELTVDLSTLLSVSVMRGNCVIRMPKGQWETSALFDIDLQKTPWTGVVSLTRNADRIDVSSSVLLSNNGGKAHLSLTSSIPGVSNWTYYNGYNQTTAETTLEYAGKKASITLQRDHERGELTIQTPIGGFEVLSAMVSLKRVQEERAMALVLCKNDHKLEVLGGCKSGSASVTFRSPFRGLEELSAMLEHEQSTDRMNTYIKLRRNEEIAQVKSVFVYADKWGATIELTLPIESYENLKLNLKLSSSSGTNAAVLTLTQNEKRWESTAEFRMRSLRQIDAKLVAESPILGYENIETGLSYNWMNNEKSGNVYLHLPAGKNEIKFSSEYQPSSGKSINSASVSLPIFKINRVDIGGEFNSRKPSLLMQVNMKEETVTIKFELLEDSVSASIKSSILGYEVITLYSDYKMESDKLIVSGFLQFNEEIKSSFNVESNLNPMQPSFVLQADKFAKHWENVIIAAGLDLTSPNKRFIAEVKTDHMVSEILVDWILTSQKTAGSILLKTPIKQYEILNLGAECILSADNLTASIVLQRNTNKLQGAFNISNRAINMDVETPWALKSVSVAGSYQGLSRSNQLSVKVIRNQVSSQLDLSMNTDKDTTSVVINTPFNICRTLEASLRVRGLSSALSIVRNSVNMIELAGELQLDESVGLNVNLSSPLFPANFKSMELSVLYDIQRPTKKYELKLLRNKLTLVDFSSHILLTETGGLMIHSEIAGEFPCFDKSKFMFEYRPEVVFMKSSLIVTKSLKEDKYSAEFGLTKTTLQFGVKTPIKGYEHFTLILNRSDDSAIVEFSTTILYYDLIKLVSQINLKNSDESFITFSMKKDEEFVNADWKLQLGARFFAKTSLSLATSYDKYEKAGAYLEYDLDSNSKGAMMAVEHNNKSLRVESILILQPGLTALEASLNATSSCFKDIKFYGGYDLGSAGLKKISVMGLWGEDLQVDVRFMLENSSPRAAKLSFISSTPYPSATFSLAGSYDLSDPANVQTITASFSGVELSTSVRAVIQDMWKLGIVSGSVGTDVNAKALGFGLVSWKLVNQPKQKEAQLVLDFGKGKKTEARILVGFEGFNNVKSLLHFIDFTDRSYEFTADWSSSKYKVNSKFGYQWNDDKQILLQSEFNYENYYPTSANIKFSSPFRSLRVIEFRNKWSLEDGAISFNSTLDLEEHSRIALSVMFSKNRLFLNVIAPNTKPMKVEIIRSASTSTVGAYLYSLDSAVSFGSWKNQFIFKHSLHPKGDNSVEASLTTPIRGVTFLHLNAQWNLIKKEAMLLIEKEHQKWGISSALLKNDGRSHLNIIVSTPFEAYEDVRLETWCDVTEGVKSEVKVLLNKQPAALGLLKMTASSMSASIEYPLKWFETMRVEYEVKLEGPTYEALLEASVGLKKAKLQASIDTKTAKTILTEVFFTSSWTEDVALSGVYEHEPSHSVRMILRRGDATAEISGTLRHVSETLKREIELESSINGERSFVIKTGYNWQQPLKKLHLQISAGDSVLRARAEGKVSREGITGDLHIGTPFDIVKLVDVKVQVEKSGYLSETGSLSLRFNDASYRTHYSIDYAPNSVIGQLMLQTPYFQIEEATVNVKHDKNYILVNVGVDGRTCDFEGSFQLEEPTMFLKGKLSAPFVKSLELMEVAFDLNMDDALLNLKTQWNPTDQIKLVLHFGISDYSLEISTPFDDLRTLELSNKIKLEEGIHKVVSKVVWNAVKIDLDGSMTLGPFNIDVTYEATHDLKQVVVGRMAVAAGQEKASGHLMMTYQGLDINIAGEIDTSDDTNLVAKLNIDIPFYDIVPITAVASLKQKSFKELLLEVNLPNVSYKVGANYALVDNVLKVGLDLDLPIMKTNIILGGSFKSVKSSEVDAEAYINNNKITASYKHSDKVLTGSMDLSAPFFAIPQTRLDVQFSTDFNPDVHGSVTLKSGRIFGTVSASLLKTAGAISTRLDVDVPLLFGPLVRTVRFSASYLEQQYFVEARYDNGQRTRSASLVVDHKTDWLVTARATGPVIGEREVTFVLQRNWERLEINLIDKLIMEIKHDANSGLVRVEYGGQEHQLVYDVVLQTNKLKGNVAINSPSLKSKIMSLQVEYENNNVDVKATVKFTSGSKTNTASVELTNKDNLKALILDVTLSSSRILRLDVAIIPTSVNVQGGASVEIHGTQHSASLNFSRVWPVDIQLTLHSPKLPQKSVQVQLAVSSSAVAASMSLGKKKFVSFDASYKSQEHSASLDFEAPYLSFVNSIHLSGAYQVSDEVSLVSFETLVTSIYGTEAQISLAFLRTPSSVYGSATIVTPFQDYRLLKATVQIPLEFSNNFDLILLVDITKVLNFSVEAKFVSDSDHLKMKLGASYQALEFNSGIKVEYGPIPTLELFVSTPIPLFRNYRLQLKRQRSLKDGDDFVNFVEWNDKRIELRHSVVNEPGKVLFRIQLNTPFSRYLAGVHFAFNDHKKALITLGFPGLEEDWIIDFDFRYKNHCNLTLLTLVQAPIFRDFKVASLMIGNKFDGTNYRAVVTGRYNQNEASLLVEAAVKNAESKGQIKAQINNQKIHLQLTDIGRYFQDNVVRLELETPFEFAKNLNLSVHHVFSSTLLIESNGIYNSEELYHLSVDVDEEGLTTLTARNPWRPVSLKYLWMCDADIKVRTEICWNLNYAQASTFGGGIFMTREGQVSVVVKVPSREVSLNASCRLTPSLQDYSAQVSWDFEQTLGYRFMLGQASPNSLSALARVDLPFRSFEITSRVNIETDIRDGAVQLLWDAASDRSKKLGVSMQCNGITSELRLQHSALKHDLVLAFEHKNVYPFIPHQPRSLQMTLEYSSVEADNLVLGYTSSGDQMQLITRHLASNLDQSLVLVCSHQPESTSGRASLSYLDSNKHQQILEVSMQVRHADIEMSVRTTENLLALNASMWAKDNGFRGVTLSVGMNQKSPLSVEARLNAEEMGVEVEASYGAGRRYVASAGMPTSRHLAASVHHQLNGAPTVDAEATLRLNTSRLLWTRVAWKLGVLEDMRRTVLQEYSDIALVAQNIVGDFANLLDEDFMQRLELVAEAVGRSTADVMPYSQVEANLIAEDFQEIGELGGEMWERNDFYMQDIHRFISNSVWYLQEKASCLVRQGIEATGMALTSVKFFLVALADTLSLDFTPLRVFCSEIRPMMSTAWKHTAAAMKELNRSSQLLRSSVRSLLIAARESLAQTDLLLDQMSVDLDVYSAKLVEKFSRVAQSYVASWQHCTMLLYDSLVAIERSFTELQETVYGTVMSVKEVRELVEIYNKYSSWLEEFRVQKYVDDFVLYLNIVGDILIEDFQRMIADYREYIDSAREALTGHMEKMDNVPAVIQAKQLANTLYQKATWMWHYLKITEQLRHNINTLVVNLDQILVRLLRSVDKDTKQNLDQAIMIVRPGLIEISQQLPVEWESFFQMPKYSQLTFPDYLANPSVGKLKRLNSLMTNVSPDILNGQFLPPFGATALVVGGQQFVTFDNRFYTFSGDCSYLLTADLVDNKFSVILNHHTEDGKPARKSLTILSEGHHIHIGANHRITVDGIKTELPTTVGNAVSISLNGNRLLVENENLMAVECNLHHDICAVKLSGWYFGKTGGLMGSFDNELANDFQMPSGEVTSDLERFTSSWRVGSSKQCSVANTTTPQVDSESCEAVFTAPDSPLAGCFATVQPQAFLEMCLASGETCVPAIAYALECDKAGVVVELPSDCVQCSVPDGSTLLGGDSISLDDSVGSADVVFVVENAECMSGVNLGKMADKLDLAMMQLGLEDNRFSVVSFGADLPPHSRTAKGDIWTSARSIEKALQDLPMSDMPSARATQDAILFASRLAFRIGASKNVILVQCGACESSLDLAGVLSTLNENAVTFHLLQPNVIQLRSATQGRAKVFGADLSGAYTARNVKSIAPSKSLLKEVILPKDHCSPLAFETNGTVFNLDRATDLRKQLVTAKKFIDVWSRRVAQSARPAKCQTCECTLDRDGVGQFQCVRCDTPAVEQLLMDWQSLLTEDYGQIEIQNAKYSDELA